jgi:hypothetical protein
MSKGKQFLKKRSALDQIVAFHVLYKTFQDSLNSEVQDCNRCSKWHNFHPLSLVFVVNIGGACTSMMVDLLKGHFSLN